MAFICLLIWISHLRKRSIDKNDFQATINVKVNFKMPLVCNSTENFWTELVGDQCDSHPFIAFVYAKVHVKDIFIFFNKFC